jgi:hypothetical protein
MAGTALQGSNISNFATGNASGTVGFAGGPQTFRAGGERFGIEGPDRGWAQNYQQAQQGAPVQQVDTYTRVEKAVPVREVEHEVARAYPVSGPRPALPGGPDTLNAPVPAVDFSYRTRGEPKMPRRGTSRSYRSAPNTRRALATETPLQPAHRYQEAPAHWHPLRESAALALAYGGSRGRI